MSDVITCTIDETGIHIPQYSDIVENLAGRYRTIYGADIYLGNDSQDGQFIAICAKAVDDCNKMAGAVYRSFSPSTAQGVGLSSNVKLNGISRRVATKSQVDLLIVGQVGTEIKDGIATDANRTRWALPALVTIPVSGEITVTARADVVGALTALPNTVTEIATPTRGWQTVTNPTTAVPGVAVESDAELRNRQAVSTALPSRTVLDGMVGAVLSVVGVTRAVPYENDSDITDVNGIPAHQVSFVVEGGDAAAVAKAIAVKKTPGVGTYGTTTEPVTDQFGIVRDIHFYRPTEVPITVEVDVAALYGYSSTIGLKLRQAVVDYINNLHIGTDVYVTKLYTPANLTGVEGDTFDILEIRISSGGPALPDNVVVAFNEAAVCQLSGVLLTVVP